MWAVIVSDKIYIWQNYEYSSSHHFYRVSFRRWMSKSARITGSSIWWLFTISLFAALFFLPLFCLVFAIIRFIRTDKQTDWTFNLFQAIVQFVFVDIWYRLILYFYFSFSLYSVLIFHFWFYFFMILFEQQLKMMSCWLLVESPQVRLTHWRVLN